MSLCDVAPTTDVDLESIFKDADGKWRAMQLLLEAAFMGKACQIAEVPLYDWLVANAVNYGESFLQPVKKNGEIIDYMPFFTMDREGVINNNYWKASSGNTTPGTAPNGTAFALSIVVESMTSIPADLNWFPIGQSVYISSKGSSGASTLWTGKVIDIAMVGTTGMRLYLADGNSGSTFASTKLQKPTYGVLMKGTNNVHPMERYCAQVPALNTTTSTPFWVQWSRWSICLDDKTRQFMNYIAENNPLYKKYYNVPEVKQNAQLTKDFQNSLAHSFLYQPAISIYQTVTSWDQLDAITSWTDASVSGSSLYWPDIEGRCVGRRAQAVGLREQLNQCGQVLDLNNDVLNLPELEDILYRIYRTRVNNGDKTGIIEAYTDTYYAGVIADGYFARWKAKSSDTTRTMISNTNKLVTGWMFRDFELPYPVGVTLRIMTHLAFDDLVTAHKNAGTTASDLEASGRKLLFIDWSTVHMGVLSDRTVTNSSGTAQDLAKVNESAMCVMDVPNRTTKLNAILWTAVVKCPDASLWIENINSGLPEYTTKINDYTDAYGKLPGH